jgi:hypothetical protein
MKSCTKDEHQMKSYLYLLWRRYDLLGQKLSYEEVWVYLLQV